MRRGLMFIGLCLAANGCAADADRDVVPVFDAVLMHEFPGEKKDAKLFLFVDGKDPAPEVLQRIRETWPEAQTGSAVGKGRAVRVAFGDVNWRSGNAVELTCGVSNGMDGHHRQYKLARKNGSWTVTEAKTTAVS